MNINSVDSDNIFNLKKKEKRIKTADFKEKI